MATNGIIARNGTPVAQPSSTKGIALTHQELDNNFVSLDLGVANGNAVANKAVILGDTKEIATLGTVTLTDLVITETATYDAEVDAGTATTTIAIDWTSGNNQKFTIGTSSVSGITFTDPAGPCHLTLKIVQHASTPQTISSAAWQTSANVYWPGGTAPTITATASAVDIISIYFDGTDYYAAATQDFL